MTQIKKETVILANGAIAILSTVEIVPGEYETMLASPDFSEEYAVTHATTEKQAIKHHKCIKDKFHNPPLSGKYLKLAHDLLLASHKAAEIANIIEDGGTCNFDSCTITLPGWNRKKVEQAARLAGVGCFVWDRWGSKAFVFPLRISAQADARSAASEAMRDHLKAMGYDAGMYYQMD